MTNAPHDQPGGLGFQHLRDEFGSCPCAHTSQEVARFLQESIGVGGARYRLTAGYRQVCTESIGIETSPAADIRG